MAITIGTASGVGTGGLTCTGITDITSGSAEAVQGTVVRAKDGEGNVVAALVGKTSYNFSVTGYSTTEDGPALGGAISGAGKSGKVTSVNIERSTEDFSKFSAEGRGLD